MAVNTYVRIPSDPNTVGDKYVRSTRFASIGSGTSGSLTLPSNSEVVLDDFGGTTDAVVTTISGGRPSFASAKTAGGTVVATTLDASGNWSLSGTPSAYPVAIVYRVKQQFKNFDSDASDIVGSYDVEEEGGASAAADVTFDNTDTGLTATDVQEAIDEVEGRVDTLESGIYRVGAGRPLLYLAPDIGHLVRANYTWTAIGQDPAAFLQYASGGTTDMVARSGVSDGISQRFAMLRSTTSGYIVLTSYGSATDGFCINSDNEFEAYCRVYIPDLSDATDEYDFRFGMTHQVNAAAPTTGGIEFVYNRDTNTNWLCETTTSSTTTSTDSGVAVTPDTWIELYMRYDSSGTPSVTFYIDRALVATNTTNIPTDSTPRYHIAHGISRSAGSATREIFCGGLQYAHWDTSLI